MMMVDAVSLSSGYGRTTAVAGPRPAAVTKSAAGPVSAPSENPEAVGDLDFLYAPGGRPEGAPAERKGGARLGVASGELNALLSSLMARGSEAPASTSPAKGGPPSVVEQFYNQF